MTSDDETLDSQSSVAGSICCCCVPPVPHRSSSAINCSECLRPTLVACLLNQFKQSSTCTQKHACSYEWLSAFILHSNLRFTCSECKAERSRVSTNNSTSNATTCGISPMDCNYVKQSLAEFENKIMCISTNLNDFYKTINAKLNSLSDEVNKSTSTASLECFVSDNTSKPKEHPKTDRPNDSSDLKAVVKSAVVETFRAQEHDKKINNAVVIYGLPEGKDDAHRVAALLEDDGMEFISHMSRIGKQYLTSSAKPRPIRVDFYDTQDRVWVIRNARRLCKNVPKLKIRISNFLSAAELSNLAKLRDECSRLNRLKSGKHDSGETFIVINDHIMEKMSDGKLRRYTDEEKKNSTQEAKLCNTASSAEKKPSIPSSTNANNNVPKNVISGSQVAP